MTKEKADAILKNLAKQVKEDTASPAAALGALVNHERLELSCCGPTDVK